MTALTVRIPDDKYRRLKTLAQVRGVSVNRLVDEMATMMLTEFVWCVLKEDRGELTRAYSLQTESRRQ